MATIRIHGYYTGKKAHWPTSALAAEIAILKRPVTSRQKVTFLQHLLGRVMRKRPISCKKFCTGLVSSLENPTKCSSLSARVCIHHAPRLDTIVGCIDADGHVFSF